MLTSKQPMKVVWPESNDKDEMMCEKGLACDSIASNPALIKTPTWNTILLTDELYSRCANDERQIRVGEQTFLSLSQSANRV